jgi:hypothetical protein
MMHRKARPVDADGQTGVTVRARERRAVPAG